MLGDRMMGWGKKGNNDGCGGGTMVVGKEQCPYGLCSGMTLAGQGKGCRVYCPYPEPAGDNSA